MNKQTRKREINPDAKREAILNAAEQLFVENGYSATSTTVIAKQADVAVGTVFRIFNDKVGILEELHRRMERKFVSALQTGWHDSNRPFAERFRPMFDELMSCLQENIELMPLYGMTKELVLNTDHQTGESIISVIRENYRQGVEAEEFLAMDDELVAHFAHGLVDGAMRYWLTNPTKLRQQETVDHLVLFCDNVFVKR